MVKVMILGVTGMLGSAVAAEFSNFDGEVVYTSRKLSGDALQHKTRSFDVIKDSVNEITDTLTPSDYVINCIGVIKPYISDLSVEQRRYAIEVNAEFPYLLEKASSTLGFKVLQIATDCVYSGSVGSYVEGDAHDAIDVYGKSKSLGEVPSPNFMHLRASIIGPEVNRSTSLLEWVRSQEKDASISGYSDHLWNGVSTKHFGRICRGIIENQGFNSGVQHLVPSNSVSKFQLVSQITEILNRTDIQVAEAPSGNFIDRTLATSSPDLNLRIWQDAGYKEVPKVEQLVDEIFANQ